MNSTTYENLVAETVTMAETFGGTSILWEKMTTQCDGYPRIKSTGETSWTSTTTVTTLKSDFIRPNAPPQPTTLYYPWVKPNTPSPAYKIDLENCAQQWIRFRSAFPNGTPPRLQSMFSLDAPLPPIMDELSIDEWICVRGYGTIPGLFSGCPEARDICVRGLPDGKPLCAVRGDRFVLIYFKPPPSNRTVDLCRPELEHWDEGIRIATDNSNFTKIVSSSHDVSTGKGSGGELFWMIAITDKIVFPARTKRIYDEAIDEEFTFLWTGVADYLPGRAFRIST